MSGRQVLGLATVAGFSAVACALLLSVIWPSGQATNVPKDARASEDFLEAKSLYEAYIADRDAAFRAVDPSLIPSLSSPMQATFDHQRMNLLNDRGIHYEGGYKVIITDGTVAYGSSEHPAVVVRMNVCLDAGGRRAVRADGSDAWVPVDGYAVKVVLVNLMDGAPPEGWWVDHPQPTPEAARTCDGVAYSTNSKLQRVVDYQIAEYPIQLFNTPAWLDQ